MKKKITAILIVMFLLISFLLLSGCWKSSEDYADERAEQIITAINNNDRATIKSAFSLWAIENTESKRGQTIDEQIDALVGYFDGNKITHWVRNTVGGSAGPGISANFISSRHTITTAQREYWFNFNECTRHDLEPERIGLTALLVREADTPISEPPFGPIPGIFIQIY